MPAIALPQSKLMQVWVLLAYAMTAFFKLPPPKQAFWIAALAFLALVAVQLTRARGSEHARLVQRAGLVRAPHSPAPDVERVDGVLAPEMASFNHCTRIGDIRIRASYGKIWPLWQKGPDPRTRFSEPSASKATGCLSRSSAWRHGLRQGDRYHHPDTFDLSWFMRLFRHEKRFDCGDFGQTATHRPRHRSGTVCGWQGQMEPSGLDSSGDRCWWTTPARSQKCSRFGLERSQTLTGGKAPFWSSAQQRFLF